MGTDNSGSLLLELPGGQISLIPAGPGSLASALILQAQGEVMQTVGPGGGLGSVAIWGLAVAYAPSLLG